MDFKMRVGSIRDLILVANELILRLEVAQDDRPLTATELWLRRSLKLKVLGLAFLQRTIARQRARVAGLKDGDATSQFYRILATSRRQRNTIACLRSGDQVVSDLRDKVGLATDYFLYLLGSAQPRDFDISLAAVGLQPVELSDLEAQFTEDEVLAAIHAMPSNKSPGPDGFSWEFNRYCWPTIKTDVMAALRAVWLGHDQGFEGLNEALLTLLPKKAGATELKDFRPISLVHSFARLLTKVLARRLAPRMDELVDKNQTAFIRGRCIQDNFLLVKESAKLLHHRNILSLLLKVDVAKAFDSISWPFLLSVLRQRGFGRRWLRWINLLLRSASTSVLVNGSARDAFRHGLRANFAKSSATPIHCFEDTLAAVAPVLSCPLAALPCTYLGLPLSIGKPRKAELQVAHEHCITSALALAQQTDSAKPWSGLDVHVNKDSLALFNASVRIDLGAGASVLFWEDPWINGLTAAASLHLSFNVFGRLFDGAAPCMMA
ncbi:hypothetical protein ACQ4PT_036547 [Festuca glaucescens]